MKEQPKRDRRRAVRVSARGRVVIHGDGYGRGEILDLSATGVRLRLAGPVAAYRRDDRIHLELRFDGAVGSWCSITGRVLRVDVRGELAVAFDEVPTDFEDWIQVELLALLESHAIADVLLVDPVVLHRREVAKVLRAVGHRVSEAATPLEAIDQLGESHYHPGIVAIADTVPAGIADDLRAFVRVEHTDLALVRLMNSAR